MREPGMLDFKKHKPGLQALGRKNLGPKYFFDFLAELDHSKKPPHDENRIS